MNQCIIGDCLTVLRTLEAGSVQCCVTSPPYFGLRDYGVDGQIGLEPTWQQYTEKLLLVFREVRRVLHDSGTCWINLGDTYAGGGHGGGGSYESERNWRADNPEMNGGVSNRDGLGRVIGLNPKNLCGIPWRVAFALQADGWYLRQDIIWSKPNPMPESVRDRCTKSHEYIFLLSKRERYYFDADAIAEAALQPLGEERRTGQGKKDEMRAAGTVHNQNGTGTSILGSNQGSAFRNKRSVWTVTTKPYSEAHFATFPPDLIEPCIMAGTSEKGCCAKCGAPWTRVTEHMHGESEAQNRPKKTAGMDSNTSTLSLSGHAGKGWVERGPTRNNLGWQPFCTCNADTVPCVVLDPFGGSGTTGQVAEKLGRRWLLIELNPAYEKLSRDRTAQQGMVFA